MAIFFIALVITSYWIICMQKTTLFMFIEQCTMNKTSSKSGKLPTSALIKYFNCINLFFKLFLKMVMAKVETFFGEITSIFIHQNAHTYARTKISIPISFKLPIIYIMITELDRMNSKYWFLYRITLLDRCSNGSWNDIYKSRLSFLH